MPLHLVTLGIITSIFMIARRLDLPMSSPPDLSAKCLISALLLFHSLNSCGASVPNSVSWSISAEMVMYLTFPLVTIIFRRSRAIRISTVIATATLLIYVSGGVTNLTTTFYFWRAITPFMFGVALYYERNDLRISQDFRWAPIFLAVLIFAGSFLQWPRLLLAASAYALAGITIALDVSGIKSVLAQKLSKFGELTYSIYMLHLLVILILTNILADKFGKLAQAPLILATICAWVIVGVVSTVSFSRFESPSRRRLNGLVGRGS